MRRKLKVLAVEGHFAPHFERQAGGILSYVGRKAIRKPMGNGVVTVFEPTGEADEVDNRVEYRHYIQKGALIPADAETARIAGVKFEVARG